MSPRVKVIAMLVAGVATVACSAILDFELETEPRCWCGEQWQGQVSGALAYDTLGFPTQIAQSDTTYSLCVSQLQHVALNGGDPTLTNELSAGSIAQCELAAVAKLGGFLDYTTCAEQGASVSHVGACWEADPDLLCPLLDDCRAKYDCDPEPVWEGYGDETGGVVEADECAQ